MLFLRVILIQHVSGGLSAYHLEDIDSDDDSMLRDEDEKQTSKSPTPIPSNSPSESQKKKQHHHHEKPSQPESKGSSAVMPSKEELLVMMEKVDRDIVAAETQISSLQKKRVSMHIIMLSLAQASGDHLSAIFGLLQAELEDTARATSGTPHSSNFSSLPSPTTPCSSDKASHSALICLAKEGLSSSSPSPSDHTSPKKTQMDIIYSENKVKKLILIIFVFITLHLYHQGKSRSAQNVLLPLNFPPLPGLTVSCII